MHGGHSPPPMAQSQERHAPCLGMPTAAQGPLSPAPPPLLLPLLPHMSLMGGAACPGVSADEEHALRMRGVDTCAAPTATAAATAAAAAPATGDAGTGGDG